MLKGSYLQFLRAKEKAVDLSLLVKISSIYKHHKKSQPYTSVSVCVRPSVHRKNGRLRQDSKPELHSKAPSLNRHRHADRHTETQTDRHILHTKGLIDKAYLHSHKKKEWLIRPSLQNTTTLGNLKLTALKIIPQSHNKSPFKVAIFILKP